MSITQEKEEKKAKILKGTAFKFRLSETKEAQWRRKYKKDSKKFPDDISRQIQMGMKKYQPAPTSGKVWDEDWKEILNECLKLIKQDTL